MTTLMQLESMGARFGYLFLLLSSMFGLLFVPTPLVFACAFFWWLFALILVLIYPRAASFWGQSKVIKGAMGAFVLLPCWTAINYIRNDSAGSFELLFLLSLIWGADSSAYFAGKKWGTTKLIPVVSPGKSLQGLLAALVSCVFLTVIFIYLYAMFGLFAYPPFGVLMAAVALSVITILFSVLGDLFESMLKRQAGLKDSGNILPGHGGILDRIDSLTAAAPVYALGTLMLSVYFS